MAAIRVLLADDDAMVLEALSEVVRADPELELVAIAEDAEQAIELAGVHRPDVAIVDIRMPGGGGVRVARELRASVPGIRVLAHSALSDHATVVQMLEHGAVGYLLKGTSPVEIALGRAARGRGSRDAVPGGARPTRAGSREPPARAGARHRRDRGTRRPDRSRDRRRGLAPGVPADRRVGLPRGRGGRGPRAIHDAAGAATGRLVQGGVRGRSSASNWRSPRSTPRSSRSGGSRSTPTSR